MVRSVFLVLSLAVTGSLAAADVRQIELRRLFAPTDNELRTERAGRIFIYEGLRDTDVDRAMEEVFDRIGSMMFIRVQTTDGKGEVRKDAQTGAAIVQDDGC